MNEALMILSNGLLTYLTVLFLLFLFSKVSNVTLSKKELTLFSISNFLIMIAVTMVNVNLFYPAEPLYFIVLSIYLNRQNSLSLNIFYGLLPVASSDLFRRAIIFFILDGNQGIVMGSSIITTYMIEFAGIALSYLFLSVFNVDIGRLKDSLTKMKVKKRLIPMNITMLLYYLLIQALYVIESYNVIPTLKFCKFVVIVYLILFLILISFLSQYTKQKVQNEIMAQKEAQIRNITQYSQQIESLYKDIRSFRHDYLNILTSLRLGIENKDLASIEKIYHQVLEKTRPQLQDTRYNIGHLANIQNDAVKGILSAKILEAQNKKIAVNVEVSSQIQLPEMELQLLDFITILSILCDNAIEAALESPKPKVQLAFFKKNGNIVFIIQNSTKEKQIDVSNIFKENYSTKGSNRGIGLAKVNHILEHYPKTSLQTSSHHHLFKQILIMK
ncbi:histidine kinase of the competence regulon,ComD [Streptococcus troglodytae]|uniref:Histidine kinase of the competence regulon,ComD n=1 Tax=Streptococcus troglodytae TaxID=1111760 RepID=A0A1L7LH79_9STRE|nr:GHKL domain-containing protein [Streptococcus troglodytae]BAQ23526.1 histidine kinase of the competence regulon,ComD [Streptococcus troglodytae]